LIVDENPATDIKMELKEQIERNKNLHGNLLSSFPLPSSLTPTSQNLRNTKGKNAQFPGDFAAQKEDQFFFSPEISVLPRYHQP